MVKDLTVRTRLRQGDEVGALAEALDALADGLAASLRSLGTERDRLNAILEAMAEGVLVTDRGGALSLVNRAARGLGVGREALGQRPIEALRNASSTELIEATRADGEARTGTALDRHGPRRVMVRVSPADAPETGTVAVLTNVTELRRLESMRRDFVANVSHELRTPVAAVRAAAETLLIGALQRPDTAEEFVNIIDRHAERLHRLVEDLLESRAWSPGARLQARAPPAGPRRRGAARARAHGPRRGAPGDLVGAEIPARPRVMADRKENPWSRCW